MIAPATTHLASVATRTDRSHGIHRTYHKAKCTCGKKFQERLDPQLAADEAASHAFHAAAAVGAVVGGGEGL